MRFLTIITLACFWSSLVFAADVPTQSLFFTPDEIQKVENLENKKPSNDDSKNDIHLGAVFYYAPENWVVWLQNEKWTPETRHDNLHILEVTPDWVRLQVELIPGQVAREIQLKPHQTYQLSSGRVIEGIVAEAPTDAPANEPRDSR